MEDHTTPATPEDLYCPACGYDLRGSPTSPRCPECGLPLDPTSLRLPHLPWLHRPKPTLPQSPPFSRLACEPLLSPRLLLPTTRAYTRTVFLVLLHPARVGAEAAKPLTSLPDARAFQRITVYLASLPLIAVAAGGYHFLLPPLDRWAGLPSLVGALSEYLTLVSFAAGTFLFFHTLSTTTARFFRPRSLSPERQTRAYAIGHYATAPLALMPLALLLSAASFWFALTPWYPPLRQALPPLPWLLLTLELSPLLLFPLTLLTTLLILKRATHCPPTHEALAAILLPPLWCLLAALFLLALPAAVAYVGLIVLSFL